MWGFMVTDEFFLSDTTWYRYAIFGEGSHISTNQKQESSVFSLLIGRNL